MRGWSAQRVADAAGASVVVEPSAHAQGPAGASVDSRSVAPGQLFVGLAGQHVDGGDHAAAALAAGAWGVMVSSDHARAAARAARGGAVLVHPEPLRGLQSLARAWGRELRAGGTQVVAITGSSGKTSTKDILAALLARHMPTAASAQNLNTEIGMPLAILAAEADCGALVLEMAMRGRGQIAELTAIAEPEVGVIVNVGPAHLELLGSLEAIAATKAELIHGLRAGASLVLPAHEPLLQAHLRDDLHTITFGDDGDVRLLEERPDGSVVIGHGQLRIELQPSFHQQHNLQNLLAAVAVARCLGLHPAGPLEVRFSAMRGQRRRLPGGVTVIDDCYNANPMSMRAAIDDLAEDAPGRHVAVLGDMLELGPQAAALHREVGRHASDRGIELLIAVGPLAAEIAGAFAGEAHAVSDAPAAAALLGRLVRDGDTVLVKGSRAVALERVVAALGAGAGEHKRARASAGDAPAPDAAGDALAPGPAGSGRG